MPVCAGRGRGGGGVGGEKLRGGGDKWRGRMRDAEEGKEGEVPILRYSLMVPSDYSLQ